MTQFEQNTFASPSVSHQLSIEDTVKSLSASPIVDGIAEFGSRSILQTNPSSDYDLLVLVCEMPARVFQMVTTIGGSLADIVLVPVETADSLLTNSEFPHPRSFEGLFVQKMKTARILYDASGRLQQVKEKVTSKVQLVEATNSIQASDLYETWFWQSFGLLHLERMAQSTDPIHLSAVDMMLTSCLSGTWRSYFDIRQIAWEGEKAAIRYWAEHDPAYLQAVRQFFEFHDRNQKLAIYRELVEQTLTPIGKTFSKGETAVMHMDSNHEENVQKTLDFWRSLFNT